jgi:NADH dehydrogenase
MPVLVCASSTARLQLLDDGLQYCERIRCNWQEIMADQRLPEYVYRDYGSLVVLGKYSTVGTLMNRLFRGSVMLEGVVARLVYLSLYKGHQVALFGWYRVALLTLANLLRRRVSPEIKLH